MLFMVIEDEIVQTLHRLQVWTGRKRDIWTSFSFKTHEHCTALCICKSLCTPTTTLCIKEHYRCQTALHTSSSIMYIDLAHHLAAENYRQLLCCLSSNKLNDESHKTFSSLAWMKLFFFFFKCVECVYSQPLLLIPHWEHIYFLTDNTYSI